MKRIMMVLSLMPLVAFATTWYVDGTTGTDENSGTSPAEAKATIQAAIDASSDNDTILVAPGTYAPIVATNKVITLRGICGAAKTIIDAKGVSQCVLFRFSKTDGLTTLEGFTLANGYRDSYEDPGAAIVGGRIKYCIVCNCSGWAIVQACQPENCVIYKNKATSFGVMMHQEAYNCTIVSNVGRIAWDSLFFNCTLRDGEIYRSYGESECCHNCCLDTPRSPEEGNFVADPHFVDTANGDYRLAADSPCIDAGDNSYVVGEADLDGSERIVNGKVDIGCYEYGSVGGPYVEKVGETNWTYMIKNGKASVGDGANTAVDKVIAGAVDVPTTLRTRPVVAIDDNALQGCTNMTSVTIPASVKTIGDSAFEGCDKLADVYYEGEMLSSIGADAFRGCYWDLIMHVPTTWQGRGRTICGYSVWKGDDPNEVVRVVSTNVVVHYMTTNVPVEVVAPVLKDTAIVNVMTEIEGGNIAIPDTWAKNYPDFTKRFGSDFSAALTKYTGKYDGAGNPLFVWQDYVAGTDPTDVYDVFTATITMVEGKPQVQWDPVLVETEAAKRVYTKYGKVKLTDEWEVIPEGEESNYNFFRVTVEMK